MEDSRFPRHTAFRQNPQTHAESNSHFTLPHGTVVDEATNQSNFLASNTESYRAPYDWTETNAACGDLSTFGLEGFYTNDDFQLTGYLSPSRDISFIPEVGSGQGRPEFWWMGYQLHWLKLIVSGYLLPWVYCKLEKSIVWYIEYVQNKWAQQ
jgi:hypothetical protein